jgi:hypothetical protein
MIDPIRTSSAKKKRATTTVDQYVGTDLNFWSDFSQKLDILDDLTETILYHERKAGLAYEKEQAARWIINKISSISRAARLQVSKPSKSDVSKIDRAKLKKFV